MTLPQVSENALPSATAPPSPQPSLHDSQHDHITSCLGFQLHPAVTTHLQNLADQNIRPRIADIKCGTGIYLTSLAQSSPIPADYTGYDDSPTRPTSLPPDPHPGLEYHTFDILLSPSPPPSSSLPAPSTPAPAPSLSTFDVLLVRGLHLLISNSSPPPPSSPASSDADPWSRILHTLSALARPGAYVQWVDFDPLTARIAATRPLAPDAEIRLALTAFTDAVRARQVGNAGRVGRELERAGFVEVDADLYPLRPRVEFTGGLVREVGEVMTRWGEWEPREGGERVQRCLAEVEGAGALVWYDLWCTVGRKGE